MVVCFFFQAEDGIRYLVRSRGLGDVYKRQVFGLAYGGSLRYLSEIAPSDARGRVMSAYYLLGLSLIHI